MILAATVKTPKTIVLMSPLAVDPKDGACEFKVPLTAARGSGDILIEVCPAKHKT